MQLVPIIREQRKPATPDLGRYAPNGAIPEEVESALSHALEARDFDLLVTCLRRLSAEHGMSEVARQTGIGRPLLYRMLRRGSNPKIGNVFLLMDLFKINVTLANSARPVEARQALR